MGDHDDSSSLYVSIGCVVFPVFVLVWYRYSRKKCCRFDGCKDGDFEMMEDEYYESSDGADDYSAMELTDRLVKWINRQNVFSGMENHPFGIRLAEGNRTGDDSKNVDCGDCFCEDLGVDNDSSGLFWECIPQTQQRAIELCSTIEALEHSDMPIVVSDSNDTLNSVIVRDLRRAAMD